MSETEIGVFMYLAFMLGACFGFVIGWLSVVSRIVNKTTWADCMPERSRRHEINETARMDEKRCIGGIHTGVFPISRISKGRRVYRTPGK